MEKNQRAYNFSAGPSMLPLEALQRAQNEFVNYKNTGMSVMEMSHRGKHYVSIIEKTESDLRELMGIPTNYKVLFLQGGASTQFAMIPLNLMNKNNSADFMLTGVWGQKAESDAKKYGKVNIVASSEDKNFSYIPKAYSKDFNPSADYFHITQNNTIYGTKYNELPQTGNVPLVSDMSSSILSEYTEVSKFGLIYAGAQKNLGPAGVTVVIVREDLIGNALKITPTMLDYKIHADEGSLYNTPPTYSIYIMGLVFEWLLSLGGVKEMQKINEEKAGILYSFLDASKYFKGTAAKEDRSLMNAPFVLPSEELNEKFIKESEEAGFLSLRGHRSVGGMRASMYNAMPIEGVKALVGFMADFEKKI